MKMNKKGFTLVELLAVIVILAVILVIAIPNVLSIIDKSRKDSTVSTAKMMVKAAQLAVAQGQTSDGTTISVPNAANTAITVKMSKLGLDNVTKDADGGVYTDATTYVLVAYINGGLRYYVSIDSSKRDINNVYVDDLAATSINTATVTTPAANATTYYYEPTATAGLYKVQQINPAITTGATNTANTCGNAATPTTYASACQAITVSNVY
jgi:type IV pilus assembly protein PilA